MLVVIAIIAILAAMLMPSLMKARAQSLQVSCLNNLKQLYLAQTMYAIDYGGAMVSYSSGNSYTWFLAGRPGTATTSFATRSTPRNGAVYAARELMLCPAQPYYAEDLKKVLSALEVGYFGGKYGYGMWVPAGEGFAQNGYTSSSRSGDVTYLSSINDKIGGGIKRGYNAAGTQMVGEYFSLAQMRRPAKLLTFADSTRAIGNSMGAADRIGHAFAQLALNFGTESVPAGGTRPHMLHNERNNSLWFDGHGENNNMDGLTNKSTIPVVHVISKNLAKIATGKTAWAAK
jgi:prepilin-type processing-associated H-X9-DG protein